MNKAEIFLPDGTKEYESLLQLHGHQDRSNCVVQKVVKPITGTPKYDYTVIDNWPNASGDRWILVTADPTIATAGPYNLGAGIWTPINVCG